MAIGLNMSNVETRNFWYYQPWENYTNYFWLLLEDYVTLNRKQFLNASQNLYLAPCIHNHLLSARAPAAWPVGIRCEQKCAGRSQWLNISCYLWSMLLSYTMHWTLSLILRDLSETSRSVCLWMILSYWVVWPSCSIYQEQSCHQGWTLLWLPRSHNCTGHLHKRMGWTPARKRRILTLSHNLWVL